MKVSPDPNEPIEFPAVIYIEQYSGNIAPIYVIHSQDEVTEHMWSKSRTYPNKMFSFVRDIHRVEPGIQSRAELHFINGATEDEIADVLARAEQNEQ